MNPQHGGVERRAVHHVPVDDLGTVRDQGFQPVGTSGEATNQEAARLESREELPANIAAGPGEQDT